ncbi:uncharacterized protein LOC125207731 [Salvia hispanica]|uniref:uncharacterized protein LOC125207731 n=1 Tax=Salvia hispanica TaxID=49212 RepID=UPI002009DAE3|nr:uncharacterized protein LOC125207731 [Salvia hispanica]
MSAQIQPSLRRVLSDTARIISSNSLHFTTLSLLLIFPIPLFNIIHTLLQDPSPSPSPSPFNSSQYQYGQLPSLNKSQLLYFLLFLIFNLFSISSVTHSTFHAFHRNPIKISSSLKSILSTFLPLLATKLAYFVIIVAISIAFGFCIGVVYFGMNTLLGLEMGPTTKPFIIFMAVAMILFVVLYVYLWVEWCLMDAVVVVESKYGFAALKRSSTLVKGMRRVAFVIIALPAVMQGIISWRFSALGGVALQMVDYAVLSTALTLFGLAANTVLLIHCQAVNGELEKLERFPSDEKKLSLSQIYVQLPRAVVDHV